MSLLSFSRSFRHSNSKDSSFTVCSLKIYPQRQDDCPYVDPMNSLICYSLLGLKTDILALPNSKWSKLYVLMGQMEPTLSFSKIDLVFNLDKYTFKAIGALIQYLAILAD